MPSLPGAAPSEAAKETTRACAATPVSPPVEVQHTPGEQDAHASAAMAASTGHSLDEEDVSHLCVHVANDICLCIVPASFLVSLDAFCLARDREFRTWL